MPDNDTLDQLGTLGAFDVAWVDMEHGNPSWRDLSDVSRTCDRWGLTPMVRVNVNDPPIIGRALDRGMQGVIVPHVKTAEEAERVVQGALYAPLGRRGLGGPRQGYGATDYYKQANEELMIVVMLEEVEALDRLDEILSVPNIDCFFVSHLDLSQSMGVEYLGAAGHPEVQKTVKGAVASITEAGKVAGTSVSDDSVEEYLELGARFLRYQAMHYLEAGLTRFHDAVMRSVPTRDDARESKGIRS